MFHCVPCLNNKAIFEKLTLLAKNYPCKEPEISQTKAETVDVMMEATKRLKKKRREKRKQMAAGERDLQGNEEGEEVEEWVAEVERGIFLTLVSEPGGGNRIEKIYFREDLFDASEARQWWNDNCEKVLDLYSIHLHPRPQSSLSKPEGKERVMKDKSYTEYLSVGSTSTPPPCAGGAAGKREIAAGKERRVVVPGRLVEWVVEDQPGVFVTVRCLPDGRQELHKIEFRGEKYGQVKRRVWWEENKARLNRLYNQPA